MTWQFFMITLAWHIWRACVIEQHSTKWSKCLAIQTATYLHSISKLHINTSIKDTETAISEINAGSPLTFLKNDTSPAKINLPKSRVKLLISKTSITLHPKTTIITFQNWGFFGVEKNRALRNQWLTFMGILEKAISRVNASIFIHSNPTAYTISLASVKFHTFCLIRSSSYFCFSYDWVL